MKHKRILVSVSMLLLSAVLLSSASYAWFSMNTDVNVDGIEFEAHSDSIFLQVSEDGSTFQAEDIEFANEPQKSLRPIAYGTLTDLGGAYTVVETPATGNYANNGTLYYEKQLKADTNDTKVAGTVYDYICINDNLKESSSVEDLIILGAGITFKPNTDPDYTGKLYQKVNNDYNYVSAPATKVGLYYIDGAITKCDGAATFNGANQYYAEDGDNYVLVNGLDEGSALAGYFTLAESSVASPVDGTTYYLKNSDNDYVAFVAHTENGTTADGYWYRGYSENTDMANPDEDAENISGVITSMDLTNSAYILHDQIFLRMAEGSADATNLRISDLTIEGSDNQYALTKAVRVLFVATSNVTGGEVAVIMYENNTGTFTRLDGKSLDSDLITASLVGNTGETITVNVYLFYDGTHESVASHNNLNLSGHSLSVSFEIDSPYYAN